jgi:hypothetical protein
MKRLAVFFVIAGLFALAGCHILPDGPLFAECSASNCPPPGSCQADDWGIKVCRTPPNASISASVTAALPGTGRRE